VLTLFCIHNIADVRRRQGQCVEARRLFDKALADELDSVPITQTH
jgi:hypothetical protein